MPGSSLANGKAKSLPVLVFSLSLLLLVLSLGLAFRPAPQSPYQGYSMFWITPVKSGAVGQAELGVHSMEFGSQSYRVELYAGSQLVQKWDDIQLAPKQEWTVLLYQQDFPEGTKLLEARLYRLDRPKTAYRQVWLRPFANLSSSPSGGQ